MKLRLYVLHTDVTESDFEGFNEIQKEDILLSADEITGYNFSMKGDVPRGQLIIKGNIINGLTEEDSLKADFAKLMERLLSNSLELDNVWKKIPSNYVEQVKNMIKTKYTNIDTSTTVLNDNITYLNQENLQKLKYWNQEFYNSVYRTVILEIVYGDCTRLIVLEKAFIHSYKENINKYASNGEFELIINEKKWENKKILNYISDKEVLGVPVDIFEGATPQTFKGELKGSNFSLNGLETPLVAGAGLVGTGLTTSEAKPAPNGELTIPTFTLWKTKKTKYYDENGRLADDLVAGNKTNLETSKYLKEFTPVGSDSTQTQRLKMGINNIKNKELLIHHFKDLIKLCSTGEMQKIGFEMVDLFSRNKSIKTEYQNPVLTKYAQEHHSTKKFKEQLHKILKDYITKNFEKLKKLSPEQRAKELHLNLDINTLVQKNVNLPTFSDKATIERNKNNKGNIKDVFSANGLDIFKGGTILVDSIHCLEVIIHNLNYSNGAISYDLDVQMFDNFGLDETDSKLWFFEYHQGFMAWYMLQKYKEHSCTPFVTNLSFKEKMK